MRILYSEKSWENLFTDSPADSSGISMSFPPFKNDSYLSESSNSNIASVGPPSSHLAGSRVIPTGSDAQEIRDIVRDADCSIYLLNTQIEILTLQRNSLQRHRDIHAALLAPVRKLPPEILASIFDMCLSEENPDRSPYTLKSQRPPLLLARICTEWREVALSTGKIWRHIRVTLDGDSERAKAQILSVDTWISRSHGFPLEIFVFGGSGEGSGEGGSGEREIIPVINTLIQHSRRWRILVMRRIQPATIHQLAPAKGRLPILQKLHISLTHEEEMDIASPFHAFSVAPQLQYLNLESECANGLDIPWGQITQCKLTMTIKGCLEVLRRMSSLIDCHLEDCTVTHNIENLPLVVSHLQTLTLAETMEGISEFLSRLSLPDLRTITIDIVDEILWPHENFLSFMTQSSFHLTRLTLVSINLTADNLLTYLTALSSLIELEVYWVDYRPETDLDHVPSFGTDILDRMKCPKANVSVNPSPLSCILPRLQILKLWGPMAFDDNEFADMVESRWRKPLPETIVRLQFVGLQYHREWNEIAIARLQQCQYEGLGLLVKLLPEYLHRSLPKDMWS